MESWFLLHLATEGSRVHPEGPVFPHTSSCSAGGQCLSVLWPGEGGGGALFLLMSVVRMSEDVVGRNRDMYGVALKVMPHSSGIPQ